MDNAELVWFIVKPSEVYPQDYIKELITWVLNPLVVPGMQLMGLMLN